MFFKSSFRQSINIISCNLEGLDAIVMAAFTFGCMLIYKLTRTFPLVQVLSVQGTEGSGVECGSVE